MSGPHDESVFGRMPLLPGERELGSFGAHASCFAYAIATWCFLTGSYAAQRVGAIEAVVCLVAGNVLGVFLATMTLSLGCQRYGLEQIDFCKPAFGQRGAYVVLVFYLINMLGWSGLILVMFGNGIRNIAEALGYQPGAWLVGAGVALGLWLTYLIVTRGVHLLKLSNSFITPGLALLVGYMLYVLIAEHGWQAIVSAPPLNPGPDPRLDYAICVELGIASGFSWWGGLGFLARNTRTARNAVYPALLHLGVSFGLVCSVAVFSSLLIQSDDPTEWMVPLGGVFFGVLALLFVTLANITSTAVSIYASGLALRHVPLLRGISWRWLIAITSLPCAAFVLWPHTLYDLGDAFLAYNGTMHAPLAGVLFVDFFLLRRGRLSLRGVFDAAPGGEYHYWRGFNVWALGCVPLGQATYLLLYNPITAESHWLFRFVPASIAAFLVPAAVYAFGMLRRPVRERVAEAHAAPVAPPRLELPNI